jgi:phospholipid/cholesterol/gamma-HCH transport system substrate-binding protein
MSHVLRQLRKNVPAASAIAVLVAIALAVGFYILRHERLQFPWDHTYTVSAEFTSAQAVTPGQGQGILVAGVKVGEISKVSLKDGIAVVDMAINRDQLPAVYANGHAMIRPRTPLQDMTIDLDPGDPPAAKLGHGIVLPASRTQAQVNLDEVLSGLDTDTRTWFTSVLNAGGAALKGRGPALRAVLRATAPTLASTRRVSQAVAARRAALTRAIGNLRQLTAALAGQQQSIGQLVDSGDATFAAFASQDQALRAGLQQLPPTLAQADRAVLDLRPLARAAAPALRSLVPAAKRLPATLDTLDPLVRRGTPALRKLTTVSTKALPLLTDLTPTLTDLRASTPSLTSAFSVLRYVTNELAYVPNLPNHSYLFWLAWFAHNGNGFLSNQDANGAFWRGNVIVGCDLPLTAQPALLQILGPILSQLPVCGKGP